MKVGIEKHFVLIADHLMILKFNRKGFTLLELLVAVAVTGLLAALLLNITTQVVTTQTKATGDLETNQAAQFILDRIQEDLQRARLSKRRKHLVGGNDFGRLYQQFGLGTGRARQTLLGISSGDLPDDWEGPDGETDDIVLANNQWSLVDSRFGVGGTWLRFFSQAPELDPEADNTGGVRAIGYQLVRYGLTGSNTSKPRYQLFRSDATAKETFEAGYDLDPIDGAYGAAAPDGIRVPKNIITPIFNDSVGPSTDFSLAANAIDFGIRALLD